jgi:hypothetical protein
MKRHLLGLLIALLAFAIGVCVVVYRNRCKAPWSKCDPAAVHGHATPAPARP